MDSNKNTMNELLEIKRNSISEININAEKLQEVIDLFAYDYNYMSPELHQEKWVKDFADSIFFTMEGSELVHHIKIGENTKSIFFIDDNDYIVINEDLNNVNHDATEFMEFLDLKPFERITIPIKPILKYLTLHHQFPSNTIEPIAFDSTNVFSIVNSKTSKKLTLIINI